MGADDCPFYLLVSFVDVLGYGWEVCVEFSDRFHDRCPVWCVLEKPRSEQRFSPSVIGIGGVGGRSKEEGSPTRTYQLSCDAVVEIFDRAFVGVGGECAVGGSI